MPVVNLKLTGTPMNLSPVPALVLGCILCRAKVKEANKRKTKDAVTKKRRKDGIDTPQSLPPRGKDQGRRKRLGDDTRGKIWESLAEHSRLVIREPTGTLEHDEED
ncbi:hypothetical protein C5167_009588 [Papaver somniferum]|uniref:Uncharacterized protein n=1 Tax=Papaver somniferum TaxID=3469 RepID=A0A4Y7JXU8_PAPSO|nr:hypothetical protein C5167_009588 [Papaver somniferum]